MSHHSPVHPVCFPLFFILLMYCWGYLSLLASKEKNFWPLCIPISLQCSHHLFLLSLVCLVAPPLDLLSCFPLLISSKSSLISKGSINKQIFKKTDSNIRSSRSDQCPYKSSKGTSICQYSYLILTGL